MAIVLGQMLGIWVPSSFDPPFNKGSPIANTNNDFDNASDNFGVDQAKMGMLEDPIFKFSCGLEGKIVSVIILK